MDQKLKTLRSQYAQQLDTNSGERVADVTATIDSGGGRRSSKSRSKRDKKSSSRTREVSSRTSKISVTYENGRITNLSTNGNDALIQTTSGFIPVQNQQHRTSVSPPPAPPANTDETDRRMSHTYYVPPAPRAPGSPTPTQNGNHHDRNGHWTPSKCSK